MSKIRHITAYITYRLFRAFLPVAMMLMGYKRMNLGACAIWAPREKASQILAGAGRLACMDKEMYSRLASLRGLVFWYHKGCYTRCGRIFTLAENFLLWRELGVALCFAQSMILLDLDKFPFRGFREHNLPADEVHQRTYNWMAKNDYPAELLAQYGTASV